MRLVPHRRLISKSWPVSRVQCVLKLASVQAACLPERDCPRLLLQASVFTKAFAPPAWAQACRHTGSRSHGYCPSRRRCSSLMTSAYIPFTCQACRLVCCWSSFACTSFSMLVPFAPSHSFAGGHGGLLGGFCLFMVRQNIPSRWRPSPSATKLLVLLNQLLMSCTSGCIDICA